LEFADFVLVVDVAFFAVVFFDFDFFELGVKLGDFFLLFLVFLVGAQGYFLGDYALGIEAFEFGRSSLQNR
jgi:hypothetical protein